MAIIQVNVTKDQWVRKEGTIYQYGGNDARLPLGVSFQQQYVYRGLLWAPIDFSQMRAINSARLYVHVQPNSPYVNGVGSNQFSALRRTADFTENFQTTPTNSTLSGHYNSDTADDGLSPVTWDASTAGWVFMDITASVRAWFNGSPNYGLRLRAQDETTYGEGIELRTREWGGFTPYIWIDYTPNVAPNAPTSLSPTGDAVLSSGTSITYSLTSSDPDSGDYMTAHEIVLYKDDGVTEIDKWTKNFSGTPTSNSQTRTLPTGYKGNQFYRWKARTKDSGQLWGPYSALQRFKANSIPSTPGSLAATTDSTTPQFSGSYSDPDPGDGMTAVQIELEKKSNGDVMWASGDLSASGTSWSKAYAGLALAYATTYRWRARVKDSNGSYSSWSAWKDLTLDAPTGPTISPRTTAAGVAYGGKQDTRTPTLNLSYFESFTDHEIFVYSDAAGTVQVWSDAPIAYTATTSKNVVVGTTLNWGTTYYWKARVYSSVANAWTAFSQIYPFYINSLPSGPVLVPPTGSSGSNSRLFEAPFNDLDEGAYGDDPTEQVLDIRDNATDAVLESRTSTTQIEKYIRIGERLEEFEETTGWVAGTSTTLSTTAGQTGNALRMAVASLANGSTSQNYKVSPAWGSATREVINDPAAQGLRPYAGGTPISIKVRASSLTNLGSVRLYFHFATPNTDFAYFTITPTTANAWETKTLTKGSPTATGGVVDWGNVTRVEVRATASGGALTSNIDVDDLIIGSIMVPGTTYKWRVAHKDSSGNLGAYSPYATYAAANSSTVTSVLPSGNVNNAVLNVSWNHSQPEGKAQGSYRITITDNATSVVVYDSGAVLSSSESATVDGTSFLVNGSTYTLTVYAFDVDGN